MNRQLEQALRHVEKHTDDETADEIRQHIEGLEKQLKTARMDALREALRIIDRDGYTELERIVNVYLGQKGGK